MCTKVDLSSRHTHTGTHTFLWYSIVPYWLSPHPHLRILQENVSFVSLAVLSSWVLTHCCGWMFDANDTLTKWISHKPLSGRMPLCHKVSGCHNSRLGWDCTKEGERTVIAVVSLTLWFDEGSCVNCWCQLFLTTKAKNHRKVIILISNVHRKTKVTVCHHQNSPRSYMPCRLDEDITVFFLLYWKEQISSVCLLFDSHHRNIRIIWIHSVCCLQMQGEHAWHGFLLCALG